MRANQIVRAPCVTVLLFALSSMLLLAQGQPTFAENQKANAQALRQVQLEVADRDQTER